MGNFEKKLITSLLLKEINSTKTIAETNPDCRVKAAAATQYLNCKLNLRKLNKGC